MIRSPLPVTAGDRHTALRHEPPFVHENLELRKTPPVHGIHSTPSLPGPPSTAAPSSSPVRRSSETVRGSRRLRGLLVASDAIWTAAGWSIVALNSGRGSIWTIRRALVLPIFVVVTLIVIAANKLYRARVCSVRALELSTMFRAELMTVGILTFLDDRLATDVGFGRIALAAFFGFVLLMLGRAGYRGHLHRARTEGRHAWPVLLVGTGAEARDLDRLLADRPELGYDVVGVVGDADEATRQGFSAPFLGPVLETIHSARKCGATGVIVAPSSVSFAELNAVVRDVLDEGMHVQMSGGLAGFASNRLRANPIGREAAFYLEQVTLTGWEARVKRALDIVLSSLLLIPAVPVMLTAAVLIKLTDRGPVLFRQQRIGRDGRPFTMLKLRTMVVNAEAKLAELMAQNERAGPLFKLQDDPRFTKIGRFLDATSLNELPQLLNVLRGEMSLVGPRPALAREVATFGDRLLMRHRVRPGITGLWQVEERDSPSFESYERCDVFYVENWSVGLDIAILTQTMGEVARRGAAMLARRSQLLSTEPLTAVDQELIGRNIGAVAGQGIASAATNRTG